MREFVTAVKADEEQSEWTEFLVDGTVCRAVATPKAGQVAVLMSQVVGRGSDIQRVGALLNFFDSMLDDATVTYIRGRLVDPNDAFDLGEIEKIMRGLMEDWSGRPTEPSFGSAPSPPNDGPSSTPPIPVSTSSAFPFIGSAT